MSCAAISTDSTCAPRPEQTGLVEPTLEWTTGHIPGFGRGTPDTGMMEGYLKLFEQAGGKPDGNVSEHGQGAVRRKHFGGFHEPHLWGHPVP